MPTTKRSWTTIAGVVLLSCSIAFLRVFEEAGMTYAMILVTISLVFEFLIVRDEPPSRRLFLLLVGAEFIKLGFAALYFGCSGPWALKAWAPKLASCGAWASFAIAVAIVAKIFRFTAAAMHPDSTNADDAQQLSGRTLDALCCVLAAFFHVTYLMTFALALHDRASAGDDLHRTTAFITLASRDTPPEPSTDSSLQTSCEAPHFDRVRKFFFPVGKSDLGFMETLESAAADKKIDLQDEMCRSEQAGRLTTLRKVFGHEPKENDLLMKETAWNLREKEELRRLLLRLRNQPHRYRVEIMAHASDQLPDDLRNSSNFDRAVTRMQAVQRLVVGLADQASIRLLYDPYTVSNAETFIDQNTSHWDEAHELGLEKKLCVEVLLRSLPADEADRVAPAGNLTLLDYLYFMVYTITTTGYGDLAPATGFARFLVSMANLFELFFIVIIFNAIHAVRREPPKGTIAPASTPAADPGSLG